MDYTLPTPLPVAFDLQGRLPPFQQILLNPTIIASLVLLGLALVAVLILSVRARARAGKEARKEALRMLEKILLKRGGLPDDVDRMHLVFHTHPALNPGLLIMMRDKFRDELRPLLEATFDRKFGERMEKIFFPPPKDTRRALAAQDKDVQAVVEEQKTAGAGQREAAVMDLMDATLKPGTIVRLVFDGVNGGYECIVMGHDMQSVNVTLPANNDRLVEALKPGLKVEGTLESGPSLMAFTSAIVQAVAGSMPYCRLAPWKAAWEVRKRDSVRFPMSMDIDFQHISTAAAQSIRMSSLEKEIGTIRPGKLVNISLGGCCVDTPSDAEFNVGDMIRFSRSLGVGNPPATLLGALVKVNGINPAENEGSAQRLHVQFLVIDDVSQRLLVRTLRQLQDVVDKDEWMRAQNLMQKMRRNHVQSIGSPSGGGFGARRGERPGTDAKAKTTESRRGRPPTGSR